MVSPSQLTRSPLPTLRRSDTSTPVAPQSQAVPTPARSPLGASRSASTFEPSTPRPPVAGILQAPVSSRQDDPVDDPSDDTVALFDGGFSSEDAHGNEVAYVLRANSSTRPEQIRKLTVESYHSEKNLDARIAQSFASFLYSTSDAIEDVLDNPGNIQVINQSQGTSKLDMVLEIWRGEEGQPSPATSEEALKELAQQLDLSGPAYENLDLESRQRMVFLALMGRVDKVANESPTVQQAKQRYDALTEKLEQKGIFLVASAGNEGEEWSQLQRSGLVIDPSFTESVLSNERDNVLIVAASTGKERGGKERIADFSSPNRRIFVATDGTDIPVGPGKKASGTSFAAPQVAALISELRRNGFTPAEVRSILQDAAKDTSAPSNQEGRGIIDMAKTKKKIRKLIQQRQQEQSRLKLKLPETLRP